MTYKTANFRQTAIAAIFAVLLSAAYVTGTVNSTFAGLDRVSAQIA
jgi:hypothetical protein